jgi:hypothetical protein
MTVCRQELWRNPDLCRKCHLPKAISQLLHLSFLTDLEVSMDDAVLMQVGHASSDVTSVLQV